MKSKASPLFLTRARFRLGLAVPVDYRDFERDLADGSARDFLRNTSETTRREVAERASRLQGLAHEVLGQVERVHVLRRRADFGRLFDTDAEVVTLVGHSPSPAELELIDERASWQSLIDAIPLNFRGMLDVRVCCAEASMADFVRRTRPDCVVRAPDGKLDFNTVAWSYARALTFLVKDGLPFDEALRATWRELSEAARASKA